MFKPSVIRALLTRYVLLYAKNPMRTFELFFWPLVQMLVYELRHGLSADSG